MIILGISCFYHDSAATLINNGKIIAAAQEERFSREKGDERFPHHSIQYCLNQAGISLSEVNEVVFYEKPFLKFERLVETYLHIAPRGLKSFLTAMPSWLDKKLNQKKLLREEFRKHFKFVPKNILFNEHHLSHASSAFFASPFSRAAVLCLDGVGEWATTSAWSGDGENLTPLWSISFPHSLGLLYSTFTHYCGFKINSGEYKLMGLAPFGKPEYCDLIKKNLIHIFDDGSYALNLKYFGFLDDLVATNSDFEQLFGRKARRPEAPLDVFYKDIAASIQSVLTDTVIGLVRKIKSDTQAENLCLAGGVALNCVTNGVLASQNIFKDIWIQPAAGDAGGSLGAALSLHYLGHKKKRIFPTIDQMQGAFLGPSFSDREIESALKSTTLKYQCLDSEHLYQQVAELLAEGQVVGWFRGRMEFGPRALGSRSILANPLVPGMQSKLNLKIKFREGFRPFAPIVTEESYSKYFSLALRNEYMLLVSTVIDPELMPAITHVDGSARVQTIKRETSPETHALLKAFSKKTGHEVLINTSFNVRGEPIVCKPSEAIDCFVNTDIDVLVMENFLITKLDNPNIRRDNQWCEKFKLD